MTGDLRRLSSDPLPPGVFDGPQPCPECGHDTSTTPTHNVRACAECDSAAELGQYAPCQTIAPDVGDVHGDAWTARLRREHERHAGIPGPSHAPGAVDLDRDRAQEARYGGRIYRVLANDPRYLAEIDAYARDWARDALRRYLRV